MTNHATDNGGASAAATALPLDASTIDSRPIFYPNGAIPLMPEVFEFASLERIIAQSAHGATPNLFCRSSVTSPYDAKATPVPDREFAGRLERRLRDENIHIMVTNAHLFDVRIRAMLDRFLERAAPFFRSSGKGLHDPSAALFLSSPGSLARFHNDLEYGFLHHARGTKTLYIYPYDDSRLNPPDAPADQRPMRSPDATKAYMDHFASSGWAFDLRPGQAVFIPPLLPHWVRAGDEIAVSITFVLFGRDGIRRRKVDHMNRLIERRGGRPTPYARSAVIDHIKCATYSVLSGLGRVKPNH